MNLDELAIKYGTDKSSQGHCYTATYEKLFTPIREQPLVILEIGTASGAGLKMLREYFPNSKVYGIDINPSVEFEDVFIGSQEDGSFLRDVIAKIGPPDVIIDDGSHIGTHQIETFNVLFKLMKSGGMYFIEDTHTFYDAGYSGDKNYGGYSQVFDYFSKMPAHIDVMGKGLTGNQERAINWHDPNPPVPEYSRYMSAMHVYPSLWMFERK